MNLIRWFKQWRAWVEYREDQYNKQLQKEVEKIIDDTCREFVASRIISHVRRADKHDKPW